MKNTPEIIGKTAETKAQKMCLEITEFITRNKISRTALAETIGVKQQNISRILDPKNKSKLHSFLLIQAGLEEMTGISFETPRITRPTSTPKTKYL